MWIRPLGPLETDPNGTLTSKMIELMGFIAIIQSNMEICDNLIEKIEI
jgi:hypothetical protein